MPDKDETLLRIQDLEVQFRTEEGTVKAIDGVSWSVRRGETLGIVGESGSGKTVSVLTVMGLLPAATAKVTGGSVTFNGLDLLNAQQKEMRKIRGKHISMIFQDPLTSLNPVLKVGHQIAEVIQVHERVGRIAARTRAVELLAEVGIANARERAKEYPHEFSGGMRQRVMIAMALALNPSVLIADEPTTALDVTVQAQIMELLNKLQAERGTAIVLISHDLGLVAGRANRVLVMYAGRVAELGDVDNMFYEPRHGYTHGLLTSLARLDVKRRKRLRPIPGQPPSLIHVPSGCPFHPRCQFATEVCSQVIPQLLPTDAAIGGPDHVVACHNAGDVGEAVHGVRPADVVKRRAITE